MERIGKTTLQEDIRRATLINIQALSNKKIASIDSCVFPSIPITESQHTADNKIPFRHLLHQ